MKSLIEVKVENLFFHVYEVLRDPAKLDTSNLRSLLTCVEWGTSRGNRSRISLFGLVLLESSLAVPICAVSTDALWASSPDSIVTSLAVDFPTDRISFATSDCIAPTEASAFASDETCCGPGDSMLNRFGWPGTTFERTARERERSQCSTFGRV